MLSDSDYDDNHSWFIEHAREVEERYESKRKKALGNESQIFSQVEQSLIVNSISYNELSKELGEDEGWFCPFIEPPLVSELNEAFRVNNEPVVKYYKSKDKFKLVNIVFRLILGLKRDFLIVNDPNY